MAPPTYLAEQHVPGQAVVPAGMGAEEPGHSYPSHNKVSVPDNKSRNIPEVVFVRRWVVGVLGIWKEGVGWVRGGANGVSLQAT